MSEEDKPVKPLREKIEGSAYILCGLVILVGLAHTIPTTLSYALKGDWLGLAEGLLTDLLLVSILILLLGIAGRVFAWFEDQIHNDFGRGSNGKENSEPKDAFIPVRELALLGAKVVEAIVYVSLVVIYVPISLSFVPETKDLGDKYLDYLLKPLSSLGDGLVAYIPNLIYILVIIWASKLLLQLLRILSEAVSQKKINISWLPAESALQAFVIARFVIFIFVFVGVFQKLPGADSTEFKAVAAFLALFISLSSTSAAGNFIAGMVLTFMRPFRAGDRVTVAGVSGNVVEVSLLATRIVTPKMEYVSIPNLRVFDGAITNYSRYGKTRGVGVSVEVSIGYDVNWKTVEKLLLSAAERCNFIEDNPAPFVLHQSLGDFAIYYELVAFTKDTLKLPRVRSELQKEVFESFIEAQIEILSPVYQANRSGEDVALP